MSELESLRNRVEELEESHAALEQMIAAQRESEVEFRFLTLQSLVGIYIFKEDRIVFANELMPKITGYTVEELLSATTAEIADAIHPEDREFVLEQARIKQMGSEKAVSQYDFRIITKESEVKWLSLHSSPIEYEGGKAILAMVVDITGRKQAEEALRDSEEKYRQLAELAKDVIIVHDMEGRITYVNKAVTESYGDSEGNILGRHINEFLDPNNPKRVKERRKSRLQGDEGLYLYEAEFMNKRGDLIPVEVSSAVLQDGGQTKRILLIARDVKERKQAFEALRESEMRYHTLFDASTNAIFLETLDGQLLDCNAVACNMYGYTRDELLKLNVSDLMPAEIAQKLPKIVEKQLKDGGMFIEAKGVRKNGKVFPTEVNIKIVTLGGKQLAIVFVKDITERKLTEEELRASEEKYRKLVDNVQDGFFVIQDGLLTFVNSALASMVGYTVNEVTGMDFQKLVAPEDLKLVAERYKRRQEGDSVPPNYEFRMLHKDGETRVPVITTVGIINYHGKVASMGTVHNITERKRIEDALLESESRYRTLAETLQEGLTIVDFEEKIIFANPAFCDIFGYSREEIVGTNLRDIVPKEEFQKILTETSKRKKGIANKYEILIRHKSGELKNIRISASPWLNEKGEFQGSIGVLLDMTEQKRVEGALRESEERFRQIAVNTQEWIWEVNPDGLYTYSSPVVERILGYKPQEIVGEKHFYDLFCPEDRENLKEMAFKAIAERESFREFENRNMHQNGDVVWLSTSGIPLFDEKGNFIGYRGADTDITERKKAEQTQIVLHNIANAVNTTKDLDELIITIQEQLGTIVDTTNFYIALYDRKSDTISLPYMVDEKDKFASFPARKTITSYVIRNDKSLLVTEADIEKMSEAGEIEIVGTVSKVWLGVPLKIGKEVIGVVAVQSYVDEKAYTEKDLEILKFASGQIAVAIERKRAEEALRDSEMQYRTVVENAKELIWQLDTKGNFVFFNKFAEEISGHKSDEEKGKSYKPFIYPEDLEKVSNIFKDTLAGNVNNYDTRILNAKGEIVNLQVQTIPIYEEGKVVGTISFGHDITQQKSAELALKESEAKYRHLIEQSNDAIYLLEEDKFTIINHRFSELLGVTPEEAVAPDFNFMDLVAPQSRPLIEERARLIEKGELPPSQYEFTGLSKDGRLIDFEASITYIEHEGKTLTQGILHDITERKKLEEQFRQSQKMEAVGRLAGGIAHDFNNLLTAIIGHVELMELRLHEGDPLWKDVDVIHKAADRAAALTGQLLAFSRKQALQPRLLNINTVIEDLDKMLRRVIGEDIEFETILHPNIPNVKADPGQIEMVIMNLIINARDAMEYGGKLTIETGIVELDEEYCSARTEVVPDSYVLMSIADAGIGMSKDLLTKVFEPFFTTKEVGKGTGLGLSTVHGIVKQSGGHVSIYSEEGKGTIVKVYLPTVDERAPHEMKRSLREPAPTGSECVLLVEDEDYVREMAENTLKRFGYKVMAAADGGEASFIAEQYEDKIDLLLTDVVMPRLNGKQLLVSLRKNRPDLKVLFMSGYSSNIIVHNGVLEEGMPFIQKPFRPSELVQKVRAILDGKL